MITLNVNLFKDIERKCDKRIGAKIATVPSLFPPILLKIHTETIHGLEGGGGGGNHYGSRCGLANQE
jgi:hypothetical protein